jgi:hypothetical protein
MPAGVFCKLARVMCPASQRQSWRWTDISGLPHNISHMHMPAVVSVHRPHSACHMICLGQALAAVCNIEQQPAAALGCDASVDTTAPCMGITE